MNSNEDGHRRVSEDELKIIMLADKQGLDRAFGWVLDDLVNVFFSENAEHAEKDRILMIINSEQQISESQQNELVDFVLNSGLITRTDLDNRTKMTYMKRNNIELLVN
jgi:hypothetical protein